MNLPQSHQPLNREIRILLLEDSDADHMLVESEIRNANIAHRMHRVANREEFRRALSEFLPEVIICDFNIPSYDGFQSLKDAKNYNPDIPCIFISSVLGEEKAVELIKRGASDFVNKQYLMRLPSAITRAIHEADEHYRRKRAEEALERLRRRNVLILDSASEGIAGFDNEMRFIFINRSGLNMLGYNFKDLIGQPFDIIIAEKPKRKENPVGIQGFGLVGTASGMSLLKLRRKDGSCFFAEFTLTTITEEHESLSAVLSFSDVSSRLQAEAEVQKSFEKMRKVLFDSIHAMSMALEFRDPYTAGHQRRVADLAEAISHKLGLDANRVDGIRLAGVVHDIGKIYVPAEILTRPGKLSSAEFELIKIHSEAGYTILKDVEYPWPIAEAVYQHHERLDGSGYPRKLKNDEIILEARIIGVADVVEAIASHRPYRPALGLEKALDEIRKRKNQQYDANVAEACIAVFEEGFRFKE
ncbi:MAG: HD domain-containing protein [Spirochaetes bacterium]|nr:HD domain-containing protein [Spirochaetota bacterium]